MDGDVVADVETEKVLEELSVVEPDHDAVLVAEGDIEVDPVVLMDEEWVDDTLRLALVLAVMLTEVLPVLDRDLLSVVEPDVLCELVAVDDAVELSVSLIVELTEVDKLNVLVLLAVVLADPDKLVDAELVAVVDGVVSLHPAK